MHSHQPAHHPPQQAPQQAPKRGVLGFALGLVVVLLIMSVAMIKVLDIRMPWDAPPGPPAPHTFDFDTEPVTLRYLDSAQGVVAVPQLDDVPATGRCAMIFASESAPDIPGYHYVLDALVTPTGQVTVAAVDTEQLRQRSRDCAGAGAMADAVAERSLDVASAVKIAALEEEKANKPPPPPKPESDMPDIQKLMGGDLPAGIGDLLGK